MLLLVTPMFISLHSFLTIPKPRIEHMYLLLYVALLLLTRGAGYLSLFSSGDSVHHVASNSGDIRTLEILRAVSLTGIAPDGTDHQGKPRYKSPTNW